MSEETTIQTDWFIDEVVENLNKSMGRLVDKSAKAGAAVVRQKTAGMSFAEHVEIHPARKRVVGKHQRSVVMSSDKDEQGRRHFVQVNYGTSKQVGRHFGQAGLVEARRVLDEGAKGLMKDSV